MDILKVHMDALLDTMALQLLHIFIFSDHCSHTILAIYIRGQLSTLKFPANVLILSFTVSHWKYRIFSQVTEFLFQTQQLTLGTLFFNTETHLYSIFQIYHEFWLKMLCLLSQKQLKNGLIDKVLKGTPNFLSSIASPGFEW